MSLRHAVIEHLRLNVPALGGRVFQAFLAPPNVQSPYATVKLGSIRGNIELPYAGDQQIEVRVYRTRDDFAVLDSVRQSVITALNGTTILGNSSPERYRLKWVPTGPLDFVDEERRLIGCLVMFETSVIYERSG